MKGNLTIEQIKKKLELMKDYLVVFAVLDSGLSKYVKGNLYIQRKDFLFQMERYYFGKDLKNDNVFSRSKSGEEVDISGIYKKKKAHDTKLQKE